MKAVVVALSCLVVTISSRRISPELIPNPQVYRADPVQALGALLFTMSPNIALPRGQNTMTSVPRRNTVSMGLKVGDKFPSSALKQFGVSGKKSVVFFYGADDAPSCSKQISAFSAATDAFKKAGFTVVGVRNAAGVKTNTDAAVKLVVDNDDSVRKEIGIEKDLFGLLGGRETYVLDTSGTIVEVHNNQFDPASHVKVALAAIEKMPKKTNTNPLEAFFSR